MHLHLTTATCLFACCFWPSTSYANAADDAASGAWRERGFQDFVDGRFGNAGQNLYVSRGGVLQRIYRYDVNRDGFFDLVFCNAQDHGERPPAYVYPSPLDEPGRRVELPADGAWSGTVADLNGDGLDDVILGMWYNGIRKDLNAFIYFGSESGFGEHRQLRLPAPACKSVAAGDFNGDGKQDLAFLLSSELRVFQQTELTFEGRRFTDLPISAENVAADDLDADGCSDLVARDAAGNLAVYWGAAVGLAPERVARIAAAEYEADVAQSDSDVQKKYTEYVADATPIPKVVHIGDAAHLFLVRAGNVYLIPVDRERMFGTPLRLACPDAMSVATGDVDGDGFRDLVFACREPHAQKERSWIYFGSEEGFGESRRTPVETLRACDVAVGDLDGDGRDEIVLCQSHTPESFTTESFVYRGEPRDRIAGPIRLQTEDARRVFLPRTSPRGALQVVFVNHQSRGKLGNPDVPIYLGGTDGYAPDRRLLVSGWGAVEAILADFFDRGQVDLLLANASENSVTRDPGSFLFLGNDDALPYEPTLKIPTTRAHGAASADLNRDGYLDLVFCGFDNPDLLFFYGGSDGFNLDEPRRLRLECDGKVYNDPRWVYLADFNADGYLDLVVPMILDDRTILLWGGPEGFSIENRQMLAVERAACARAADLDGDGRLDLILGGHNVTPGVPHDSFVYIYWNGPEGLREDRRSMLPSAGVNSMAIADFNGDGTLDLFAGSYSGAVSRDIDSYLYWNRKGTGFSEADRDRLFTHSASGCVAADFNEDGRIDLAVANHKVWGDHVGWSGVWWNGPEGFDEKRVTRLPTLGPHGMMLTPGNQSTRGTEEYYESSEYQLPPKAAVTNIRWEADLPPKTWVRAQLRFAATRESLRHAAWSGPGGVDSWYASGDPVVATAQRGLWVQYRLALGATSGLDTPRVKEVTVAWELSSSDSARAAETEAIPD